jgi:hypothetical protein
MSASEAPFDVPLTGDECEVLLEMARPDLYRVNAFRVSELPVDASARTVSRQADKIRMMEKYHAGATRGRGALALSPRPDGDAFRTSLQQLRDPERRLIHEFFWFWPIDLEKSASDKALLALSKNDIKSAADTWSLLEKQHSENNVSKHNLAVLLHMVALDLEHDSLSRPLTPAQISQRDGCWRKAYHRWRILLNHEGFWSRLKARIRQLDDPRLTTGTGRRVREALPLALLLINAEIAVREAERGNAEEARRHLEIMKNWEATNGETPVSAPQTTENNTLSPLLDEAFRRALKPIRDRIKTFSRTAAQDTDAAPEKADAVVRRLVEQTGPLLKTLDTLLPEGNALRDGAHDEVALQALASQIAFGNKTEDWKASLELLNLARPIAASESARARIDENIRIVTSNLEFGTCWFCSKRPSKTEAAADVPMHGNVNRIWNQVQWQHATVKVPRCEECKAEHSRRSTFGGVGAATGALLGLGGCVGVVNSDNDMWLPGVIVMVVTLGVGAGIGALIAHNTSTHKDTKPESYKTQHPAVKKLLSEKWGFGLKPPGVQ